VEEEVRHNRAAFTAPSVDPLDAALERMSSARSAGNNVQNVDQEDDELDVDEDEATTTVTTADDDSEEDDFVDDDDDVEANTPSDDDDEIDDDSTQVQRDAKPAKAPKSGDKKQSRQGSDEEDDRPLSRKQRGKLIEELRQTLEEEQKERQRLEQSLAAQKEEDAKLEAEVNRALGTDEEFDKAQEDGLSGDTTAAEKARIWKANRAFYKKLLTKSEKQARDEFLQYYWQGVAGLPGVTQQALQAPNLADILKNLYDAGVSSVTDESAKKIEQLTDDVETWKGRYRSLKAKAGGARRSPVSGGGVESPGESTTNWRRKYTDPKTGLFTDEAEAIVSRYGIEALKNPKLIKAR
jgi:hypothetical protein